ncbi:hypothetical protein GXB81_04330 [Paraburkholderia sp. Ac-20336]|uniref:hypothetical protein n=1 Tax=Burkholderiaceae TaxID=119060 RepID=UPI0014225580|nr:MULTISPECIES: hypothetical protein [Burkholderiaceae]MBN3802284.1 hypothetical protein [Paraburkholderia sp. Ac-20336]
MAWAILRVAAYAIGYRQIAWETGPLKETAKWRCSKAGWIAGQLPLMRHGVI